MSDDNRFFGDSFRASPTHLLSKENVDVLKFLTTCVLRLKWDSGHILMVIHKSAQNMVEKKKKNHKFRVMRIIDFANMRSKFIMD